MNMVKLIIELPLDQIKDLLEMAESEQLTIDLCIRRAIIEYMRKEEN